MESGKQLKRKIIDASNVVRQKYQALKTHQADDAAILEKTLQPILEPLNTIATASKSKPHFSSEEDFKSDGATGAQNMTTNESMAWDYDLDIPEFQDSTYHIRKPTRPLLRKVNQRRLALGRSTPRNSTHVGNSDYEDYINDNETLNNNNDVGDDEVFQSPDVNAQDLPTSPRSALIEVIQEPRKRKEFERRLEENVGPLTAAYIMDSIDDTRNIMDRQYGIRHAPEGYIIGDSIIRFDRNHLYVKDIQYRVTPGVLELLFKRIPDDQIYTEEDLIKYGKIVDSTNAHKRGYIKTSQINGNKSYKYRQIIQKLFPSRHRVSFASTGEGLNIDDHIVTTNSAVEYTYWDDPNELVDRLWLLNSSEQAGHTGHRNEIISIVNELRDAQIID